MILEIAFCVPTGALLVSLLERAPGENCVEMVSNYCYLLAFRFFLFPCSLAYSNSWLLVATHFNVGSTFVVWSSRNQRHASINKKQKIWSWVTATRTNNTSTDKDDIAHEEERIESVFSTLARTGKTKRRLSHFLDLALCEENPVLAIADIGCDHGILSFALAFSGRYSSVIGVDASKTALENGAINNMKKLGLSQNIPITNPHGLATRVEFRLGNGLSALNDREVNCVCLAGMGVDTIMKILFSKAPSSSSISELERIGCKFVYVQPPNPRPRHLMRIYDALQTAGYDMYQERIEEFSNHWYITTAFVKRPCFENKTVSFPGSYLASQRHNAKMFQVYLNYVNHHRQWIMSDFLSHQTFLSSEDARWLEQTAIAINQPTERQ